MIVLGVDPGAYTALVVRSGDRLLAHRLLKFGADGLVDRLEESIEATVDAADELAHTFGPDVIAVEGAVAPTAYNRGRLRMIDPAPIIATAHLVGALAAHGAAIVPPAGFGAPVCPPGTNPAVARRILIASYPAPLVGPRETTGAGKSPYQHLRAAWDLCAAARTLTMTQELDL
jgi:hypothetical protein